MSCFRFSDRVEVLGPGDYTGEVGCVLQVNANDCTVYLPGLPEECRSVRLKFERLKERVDFGFNSGFDSKFNLDYSESGSESGSESDDAEHIFGSRKRKLRIGDVVEPKERKENFPMTGTVIGVSSVAPYDVFVKFSPHQQAWYGVDKVSRLKKSPSHIAKNAITIKVKSIEHDYRIGEVVKCMEATSDMYQRLGVITGITQSGILHLNMVSESQTHHVPSENVASWLSGLPLSFSQKSNEEEEEEEEESMFRKRKRSRMTINHRTKRSNVIMDESGITIERDDGTEIYLEI